MTINFPAYIDDVTVYEVILKPANYKRNEHIKTVAKALNINLLESSKRISLDLPISLGFSKAVDVIPLLKTLFDLNMDFEVM